MIEDSDSIWFIQNNGTDGDNWSFNNYSTGGAGAIAWCIATTPELKNAITRLKDAINQVSVTELEQKEIAMRKCFSDIPWMVDETKHYPCLPLELTEFYAYVRDGGHSICCIPKPLLDRAKANGDLDMFEVPLPVKYVLAKGYEKYNGHLIVEVVYDAQIGAIVDETYSEY